MREDWNMDARVEHHFLHDILEVYFKALHPAAAPIHGFCNDPRNTVWHLLAKRRCRKGIQIVPSFPGTFLLVFHFLLLPQYFAASTANAGKQVLPVPLHLLWRQAALPYLWTLESLIKNSAQPLCAAKPPLWNLYRVFPNYCIPISVFLQRFSCFFVQNAKFH